MLLVTSAFILFLVIGMPVAFAIGISGALFFLLHPELPATIPIQLTADADTELRAARGAAVHSRRNFMNKSGITEQLLRLATVLTGRLRGGLAQVRSRSPR